MKTKRREVRWICPTMMDTVCVRYNCRDLVDDFYVSVLYDGHIDLNFVNDLTWWFVVRYTYDHATGSISGTRDHVHSWCTDSVHDQSDYPALRLCQASPSLPQRCQASEACMVSAQRQISISSWSDLRLRRCQLGRRQVFTPEHVVICLVL